MVTVTRLEQRTATGPQTSAKMAAPEAGAASKSQSFFLFNSFMQAGVVLWLPLLIGLMESGNLIRPSPLID
jgi:hypothetical protein